MQKCYLALGCFWKPEEKFKSQKGIIDTEVGYGGGYKSKVTYASSQVNYPVKPGRMIFFPSYMPHQYVVDMGYEPFRFIHWNCQAIPKGVLNVV